MLGEFRKLDGWARWAVILIAAVTAMQVLESILNVALMARIDARTTEQVTRDSFSDLQGTTSALASIWLLLLIGAGIAFIGWLHSAYSNIVTLGAVNLRRSAGWAIGSWFIPLISLIWPKEIVNDTWRASDPSLPAGPSEAWKAVKVPNYVHWWWACYLVGGVLSRWTVGNLDVTMDRGLMHGLIYASTAGTLITVAGALLAIKMVKELTASQNDRRDRLGPQAPYAQAGPAPAQALTSHPAPPPPPPPAHDAGFRPGPAAG